MVFIVKYTYRFEYSKCIVIFCTFCLKERNKMFVTIFFSIKKAKKKFYLAYLL